jgi:replicative DNA helicase
VVQAAPLLSPKEPPALASDESGTFRVQPHNIEAEQALLGAILVNNDAYHRVAEYLRPEHFFEPVHARIFERCVETIGRAQLADPVTLKRLFEEDPALRELDGARYLSRLAQAADTIVNAADYGRIIHDLALKRGLIKVGEDSVNRAFDPSRPESGRDQIELAEQELYGLVQEGESRGEFRAFPVVLTEAIKHIESAWHKIGKVSGVPTKLTGLDQKLGGLQPSDLLILAGRPSMGKTALAVTIAANAASAANVSAGAAKARHANYVVGVFSLEMSAEQLATRLLSGKGRIESDRLRRGDIGEEDWPAVVRASRELGALPLFIDDTPALSIAALRTRARRLKRTQGLDLLVIDYLQLLRGTGAQSQTNRVQEITEITQGLKAMAKDLHVPVLALSQLSRAVESREDKRPMLSDLRESGSIEQDADVVLFVFREEYYLSRAIPTQREGEAKEKFDLRYQEWFQRCQSVHNKAEVIIAKQRHGPIGNVHLQFDANFGQFNDLEPGRYPEHLYG